MKRTLSAFVLGLALLTAACGSDDDGASEAETTQPAEAGSPTVAPAAHSSVAATEPAATGDSRAAETVGSTEGESSQVAATGEPILIGINNSDQGGGQDLAYLGNAIEAWAAYVNEHGGIDGRPVETERCNDQASQEGATACTREMVQNDNIVAVVGYSPLMGSIQGPTFAEAGIPYMPLLGRDQSSVDGTASTLTVVPGAIGAFGGGLAQAVVENLGATKIAVIRLDVPSLDYTANLLKESVALAGGEIVAEIKHPPTTSDFSATVVQAQSAGAEAIVGMETTPGFIRLIETARSVGLDVPFAASGATLTPDFEAAVQANDATVVLSADFPDPRSDDPELIVFREAMEAAGHASEIDTVGAVGAWAAARYLETAMTEIGAAQLDRDAILSFLENETLDEVPMFEGPVGPEACTASMPALGYCNTYIVTVDAEGRHYADEPTDFGQYLSQIGS